ncbi:sporulation membrane protein YtaF [Gracilibacillus alcaliphilus]|uniref:sporulation membrane protein YtaF n=1 Tax=Gracilibacillus alcaliphilus TaxID=1401441 RepID=UPI0019574630|nr:sporulation membrane protein YtaF [Gracilibacillus alcaliphilus]MBM7676915.1 putative sporulation protein YtaF [Gracilibacillus alcaliphilus]
MMLLLLIMAISMDSFFVAFTYGLRGIALPVKEWLKISLTVTVVFMISMFAGTVLSTFISVRYTEIAGGVILIVVGLFLFFSLIGEGKSKAAPPIFISILKKPMTADIDKSGNINGVESIFIGIALSLDSFGAGIGIYLLGASPWTTPLIVFTVTVGCLLGGIKLGQCFSSSRLLKRLSFLPSCLLILIGIWKVVLV